MDVKRSWTRFCGALHRYPILGDTFLAAALPVAAVGFALIGSPPAGHVAPSAADLVALAFALLAVAARRRFTVSALVVTTVAASLLAAVEHQQNPVLIGAIVLLIYTFATHAERRDVWLTSGVVVLLLAVAGLVWGRLNEGSLGVLAWIGIGAAVGDATRSRLAYITEVEHRARQAEQTRDEEARLRVAQERMRIARELHDVLAHNIAAIKVQSTGARHVLAGHPEQAATALEHISRLSDGVLKEMSSVIGLLRHDPERDTVTIEPPRGLTRLAGLLDDCAATGLAVELHQVGSPRELPVLADLAAYRIIQESLTNAHKYGEGVARMTLAYTPAGISIDITNTIRPGADAQGSGFGIPGMSERVAANGGALSAGPCGDGRFAVCAELSAPIHVGGR